jgi:uncharacterized membrane protein
MARLPTRHAPLAYGVIQVAITTAVATGIAICQSVGFSQNALLKWVGAWLASLLVMLPLVVVISPLVQRLVKALTADENGPGS